MRHPLWFCISADERKTFPTRPIFQTRFTFFSFLFCINGSVICVQRHVKPRLEYRDGFYLFIYIHFFLLPVNCRFPVWSSIDQYSSIDCSHTRPLSLQHFPYFLLGFLPLGASWIRRREKEAWAWHCPRWRHHLRIGKRTDETSGGKSIGRTTWRAHLRL
jgi:hypothetical protein